MKVHVESRRGYRIKSQNRPFRRGSAASKKGSNSRSRKKTIRARCMETRRRKYFNITVCLMVSGATKRPHEGMCDVGRSDVGLNPGCLSGHDKSMFSWKRREGSPTRMTAQGAETDCYSRQFFQEVFLWREWENGAVAGGRGGGGWVFKICCGKKVKQYNLSINGGMIKLLAFQWHTTVCAYMRAYILLYI